MRISDWSSDVCSSDLPLGVDFSVHDAVDHRPAGERKILEQQPRGLGRLAKRRADGLRGLRHLARVERVLRQRVPPAVEALGQGGDCRRDWAAQRGEAGGKRSEEHTSELQSLMRISYAVFCLNKKNT